MHMKNLISAKKVKWPHAIYILLHQFNFIISEYSLHLAACLLYRPKSILHITCTIKTIIQMTIQFASCCMSAVQTKIHTTYHMHHSLHFVVIMKEMDTNVKKKMCSLIFTIILFRNILHRIFQVPTPVWVHDFAVINKGPRVGQFSFAVFADYHGPFTSVYTFPVVVHLQGRIKAPNTLCTPSHLLLAHILGDMSIPQIFRCKILLALWTWKCLITFPMFPG